MLFPYHDVAEWTQQEVPHPPFFIQHILPKGGILMLYGDAGVMKSWMALHTAFCIATGSEWFDFRTYQARVLIVNFEIAPWGYHDRLVKVNGNFSVEIGMLMESSPGTIFLDEPGVFEAFKNELIEPLQPDVIILDCLARCYGGDENSNQELGRFFLKLDELKMDGRSIILIHHCNKSMLITSTMGRARGGTRLTGDPDSVIRMVEQPTGRQLQFEKNRLCDIQNLYSKNIIFENYLWRLR